MAILRAKARQSTGVSRVSEGENVYLKAFRDGTLTLVDWIGALSLEGRVFHVCQGTYSDAKAFGATVLDTAEFDLHVAVPSSTVIIPIELKVVFDVYGSLGIIEVIMASGSGSTVGSGDTVTPVSCNINSGMKSACTVTGSATASTGVAIGTNYKEIWRDGLPRAKTIAAVGEIRDITSFHWRAMDSGILDVVGPSQQLGVYASANAGTGFIQLRYIELPSSAIE